MKVTITSDTCIVDAAGSREAKAGAVVEVSDRDGAHLIAVGKAEPIPPSAVTDAPLQGEQAPA